jgi:hypothetical protein
MCEVLKFLACRFDSTMHTIDWGDGKTCSLSVQSISSVCRKACRVLIGVTSKFKLITTNPNEYYRCSHYVNIPNNALSMCIKNPKPMESYHMWW